MNGLAYFFLLVGKYELIVTSADQLLRFEISIINHQLILFIIGLHGYKDRTIRHLFTLSPKNQLILSKKYLPIIRLVLKRLVTIVTTSHL